MWCTMTVSVSEPIYGTEVIRVLVPGDEEDLDEYEVAAAVDSYKKNPLASITVGSRVKVEWNKGESVNSPNAEIGLVVAIRPIRKSSSPSQIISQVSVDLKFPKAVWPKLLSYTLAKRSLGITWSNVSCQEADDWIEANDDESDLLGTESAILLFYSSPLIRMLLLLRLLHPFTHRLLASFFANSCCLVADTCLCCQTREASETLS